jgi:hypothetical protein
MREGDRRINLLVPGGVLKNEEERAGSQQF